MDTTYHFIVNIADKRTADYRSDYLCLNGSAHALTAHNKAAVTCKKCLAILELEKQGKTREEARQIVIWGDEK